MTVSHRIFTSLEGWSHSPYQAGIGFIVALMATDANSLPVNRSRSDPRIRGIIVVGIAIVVQVSHPLGRCTEGNQKYFYCFIYY